MGIDFERGAFENPEDPSHGDDVDSDIVVVTAPGDRTAALTAVERCIDRWRGIDGAGRYHGADDEFWNAQADHEGHEWHTAKYISKVRATRAGVEVDVDAQGLMPAAMRAAFRRVLTEELAAAGVHEAVVRSQHAADYEPIERPTGSWPPYADSPAPGLPPGIPPGGLLDHDLKRQGYFSNWLLKRDFRDAWEAFAVAVADCGEEEAVQRACRLFSDAGWTVGEPRAIEDWDHRPMTAATMSAPGAVAFVTCQARRHAKGRGLKLPKDAAHVVIAVAYYDIEPPEQSRAAGTAGSQER